MTTPNRDPIGLPFALFRSRVAVDFETTGIMTSAPAPEGAKAPTADAGLIAERMQQTVAEGIHDGSRIKLLFARPGMSLAHVWFKSGFPLPRHSHNAECLYFIIAGSLRIGVEELGPGDGFDVGKDVPYAYTPGPQGVELLEFRTSDAFDIKLLANNPDWWGKALERLADAKPNWPGETAPPSGLVIGADAPG